MIIKKQFGCETDFFKWGRFYHFTGSKQKDFNCAVLDLPFDTDCITFTTEEARQLRDALTEYLDMKSDS